MMEDEIEHDAKCERSGALARCSCRTRALCKGTKTLKQRCEELGIHVMSNPLNPWCFTYLGVFPPARTWETEDDACRAALTHYNALQSLAWQVDVPRKKPPTPKEEDAGGG